MSKWCTHGHFSGAFHKGEVIHQECHPLYRKMREKYLSNNRREFKLEKPTQVPFVVTEDKNIDGANLSLRKVKLLAFIQPISLLENLE